MNILLIDDDQGPMRYYVKLLELEGCKVTQKRIPDDALNALNNNPKFFDLIILDSAIPPGKIYANEETDSGMLTGGLIFRDIRKSFPKIPIFVLTNFAGLDWIRSSASEPLVEVGRKLDLTPSRLVEAVKQLYKKSRS